MPTEIISVTSQIDTNAARDWWVASDYWLDDQTPDASILEAFWANAVVSLSAGVDNQVRLYARNNIGSASLIGIVPPHVTSIELWDIVEGSDRDLLQDAFGTVEQYVSGGAVGAKGVYWATTFEGDVMPASVTIESTWPWERVFGRDPDVSDLGNYTMRTLEGDDVSTWEASTQMRGVADSTEFAATIAQAGFDNDVDAAYYTIAVYDREVVEAAITGRYLGADRRFMGF